MKEEKRILNVLGQVDEKYIDEAAPGKRASKKPAWIKWGAMAACLCLVTIAVFTIPRVVAPTPGSGDPIPGNNPSDYISPNTNLVSLVVNELNSAPDTVATDAKYEAVSPKIPQAVWETIMAEFKDFTGRDYEDFISTIPATFENVNFYTVSLRGYKDNNLDNDYNLHDYAFEFRTATGGKAWIALCSFEQPLKDYLIKNDNPDLSEINDTKLAVYSYENTFYVSFTYDDVNYDIKASDISQDNLYELLSSIIAPA